MKEAQVRDDKPGGRGREGKLMRIDGPLHKRLKVASAQTGRSMRELAEEALVEYLDRQKSGGLLMKEPSKAKYKN